MLVQYEATTKKSTLSVLVGEASTFKAKGKRAGRWKRKKGKAKAKVVVIVKDAKSAPVAPLGLGKGKKGLRVLPLLHCLKPCQTPICIIVLFL
ncbi:UNVERIFIED_CONTAM: hypothetical protein Sradi_6144400 [Sesamum radiatum]|uniref:Uncharacterized protein n=1 Tax=Sesamum radiatum TaxID=300843 RepID=A0AAW2KMU5_SESRA